MDIKTEVGTENNWESNKELNSLLFPCYFYHQRFNSKWGNQGYICILLGILDYMLAREF